MQPVHPVTDKCPWVSIDGMDIADSQLSIEKLAETFKLDLYENVTIKERAIAESLRVMIEEYLYWVMVMDR